MTSEEATERLTAMVAATDEPVLDTEALELLLADHVLAEGRWDLLRAAAEGWRRKAAQLVGKFDVGDEAAQAKRSQIYEHCRDMAREYDARAAAEGVGPASSARPLARFSC